jgi:hypothetical protein
VAQVDEIGVSGYDAATQYQLLVNGEIIASTSGGGTANQVATALASAWNAVTGNPYAVPITALAVGSDVRFTADIAGVPFTVSAAVTGGAGTIGTATGVTASEGPNDWSTPANWSGAAVPVNADDVVFRDASSPALWGLAQSAVTLASLVIEQTYTGTIGLNKRAVVTGAAGASATGKAEYREDYLDIGWDECRIGEILGPGSPAGATRLKLDNAKAGASTTTIFNTSASSADPNQAVVRLLAAHASADILVRNAGGGVGIGTDDAGETSTVGDVSVSDQTAASRVFIGEGVTLDTFTQDGGDNVLRAAAGVTGITVNGGQLAIEGSDYDVGTLTVNGGTVYPNSVPTGGAAIATVTIDGGTVDGRRSRAARTWTTVNMKAPGSTLRGDTGVITITTLNEPTGGYGVQVV